MRIVFVLRSLVHGGGVERTLTDKANYLYEQGHEVVFLPYEIGCHPLAFPLKSTHIDLGCPMFRVYSVPFYLRLFMFLKMSRIFKKRFNSFVDEFSPDVIVVTTYSDDVIKDVMSVRKKSKIVVESHSAFTHDMQGGTLLKRIKKFFHLKSLKECHLLIALTKGDAACWRRYISNVVTVQNPVPFYCEDISKLERLPGRILAVGRYHPQKRFDRLISAFAMIASHHPQWYIDIFGEGPEETNLRRQIEAENLEDRIFLHASTKDIFSEYKKSQMFVLSSDYEGLPLVLLEAMACGVAPISTKCPFGPDEVIEDGVTGLLANLDVHDLAQKMYWLIDHEQERLEMGFNAYKSAARYKKEVVMKEWESAYLSVL